EDTTLVHETTDCVLLTHIAGNGLLDRLRLCQAVSLPVEASRYGPCQDPGQLLTELVDQFVVSLMVGDPNVKRDQLDPAPHREVSSTDTRQVIGHQIQFQLRIESELLVVQ